VALASALHDPDGVDRLVEGLPDARRVFELPVSSLLEPAAYGSASGAYAAARA
jgi:hypothetical protein